MLDLNIGLWQLRLGDTNTSILFTISTSGTVLLLRVEPSIDLSGFPARSLVLSDGHMSQKIDHWMRVTNYRAYCGKPVVLSGGKLDSATNKRDIGASSSEFVRPFNGWGAGRQPKGPVGRGHSGEVHPCIASDIATAVTLPSPLFEGLRANPRGLCP